MVIGVGRNYPVRQLSCEVPMQPCDMVANHLSPLALCHRVTLKDERVTALLTPLTKPAVTVARNASAHFKHIETINHKGHFHLTSKITFICVPCYGN